MNSREEEFRWWYERVFLQNPRLKYLPYQKKNIYTQ